MKKSAFAIAALALTLGCTLAGCKGEEPSQALPTANSSSASSSDGASKPAAPADPADAMQKYAKCMRDNGVNVPDPGPDGGIILGEDGEDPAVVEKAMGTCAPLLESMVKSGPDGAGQEAADAALKVAACMREKGHDFADPSMTGSGDLQINAPGTGEDPEAWQTDLAACASASGAGK